MLLDEIDAEHNTWIISWCWWKPRNWIQRRPRPSRTPLVADTKLATVSIDVCGTSQA